MNTQADAFHVLSPVWVPDNRFAVSGMTEERPRPVPHLAIARPALRPLDPRLPDAALRAGRRSRP